MGIRSNDGGTIMDEKIQAKEFDEDWKSFRWLLKQDLHKGDTDSYHYRIKRMKTSMGLVGVKKDYIKQHLPERLTALETEVKREQRLRMNA